MSTIFFYVNGFLYTIGAVIVLWVLKEVLFRDKSADSTPAPGKLEAGGKAFISILMDILKEKR